MTQSGPTACYLAVMTNAILLAFGLVLHLGFAQNSIPAPDFKLHSTNGKVVQLSGLKGQPVVLVFWATWCHICEQEMPRLNAVYQKNPGKFAVVAVHFDPGVSRGRIEGWVKDHKWGFPALLDAPKGAGMDSIRSVVSTYGVRGTPTIFFIDKSGMIKLYNPGGMSENTFRLAMEAIGVKLN